MPGLRTSFIAVAFVLTACGTTTPGGDTGEGGTTDGPTTSTTGGTFPTSPTSSPTTSVSGTGTTTEPGTDTSADSSSGGSFIGADMGGGGVCNVFAQDCPKGDKCMPWADDGGQSWNSTTCVPVVPDPGQVGDPCTVEGSAVSGVDDCDVGMMCYNVSAQTNMGTCFELCGGSSDAPTCDDGLCAVYNDGNLPLCLDDCDPLLQDCGPEQLCLASPNANGFVCILDSLPGADGGYGTPCQYVNTCDPGFFCAVQSVVAGCANATGCCEEFCDITQPNPDSQCTGAGSGEQCQPWYGMDPPPPGYEDVGFCGIPL